MILCHRNEEEKKNGKQVMLPGLMTSPRVSVSISRPRLQRVTPLASMGDRQSTTVFPTVFQPGTRHGWKRSRRGEWISPGKGMTAQREVTYYLVSVYFSTCVLEGGPWVGRAGGGDHVTRSKMQWRREQRRSSDQAKPSKQPWKLAWFSASRRPHPPRPF